MIVYSVVSSYSDKQTVCIFSTEKKAQVYIDREEIKYPDLSGDLYILPTVVDEEEVS